MEANKAKVEQCPTCGQEMRKYWHTLTPGLVEGLMKFGRAVQAKGRNSVHLRQDMDGHAFELTRDQWSNFTKLRFHGLVAKDRHAGQGYWLLTARGASFLRGDLEVPSKVQTFNNHVEAHGGNMVTIRDVHGLELKFERVQDIDYEVVPKEIAQTSIF